MRDAQSQAGHPVWSPLAAALAGALAAVLAFALVQWRVDPAHFALGAQSPRALGASALAGALMGAVFGRLTRRLFPIVPRILFHGVLTPSLCIVVYAFGFSRYAPHLAQAVPFVASLLGAATFGVIVALVPPIRVRGVR
jgi:hypothetical protein